MKCRRINARKEDLTAISEELGLRSKMELGPIIDTVNGILADVRENRDTAVLAYTKRFDKADLTPETMRVTPEEIASVVAGTDPELLGTIRRAAANILAFHEKQREAGFSMDVAGGSRIGMLVRPLSVAGIYVPGGTAPLPSTVLMNVIPAKAAGVPRVVLCTPPRADGSVSPVILAAASIAGADEIYKVGGAQAIAAMACGTAVIPRVDKICGPGNIYVNTAKRLVFGQVDIDMFAGPSEILIVADSTANPEFVAADMLSQAEHDKIASAILLTTDAAMADAVEEAIDRRSELLERREILEKSVPGSCAIVLVEDIGTAIDFVNELAPEHLELCIAGAEQWSEKVTHAGAIFLGNYTPEPLGDYFAGPNHTLPTSGTARFFSPLNTGDFQKKISILRYTEESLKTAAADVVRFAEAEGLTGHAAAVKVRFEE